ncbi:MAG: hypothetical protein IJ137_00290 [Eubacterium sp.]|nr:hypothetical protein [Eubacterium sp.]
MAETFENKLQSILKELESVKAEMVNLIEVVPSASQESGENSAAYLDDALISLDDVIGRVSDGLDEIK